MIDSIKILIVEDEPFPALFLKNVFTRYGFTVVKIAATGNDAIQSAINDSPDVILMDIHLIGVMNGIEAAAEILTRKKIPIIFATGYDDEKHRADAAKLNPAGYYVKPISLESLEEIIEIFKKSL